MRSCPRGGDVAVVAVVARVCLVLAAAAAVAVPPAGLLAAAAVGNTQIAAAAAEEEAFWAARLGGDALSAEVRPSLRVVEQGDQDATAAAMQEELKRREAAVSSEKGSAAEDRAQDENAVRGTSAAYARSRAENAAWNLSVGALDDAAGDEARAAALRRELEALARAAAASAKEAAVVARESRELVGNVSSELIEPVARFAAVVEAEARSLRDEAAQSERLSRFAGQVANATVMQASRSLRRAAAAEALARQALAEATENAATLTQLHGRAQAAEQLTGNSAGHV